MNDHRGPSSGLPDDVSPHDVLSVSSRRAEPIAIIGIGCIFPKAPSLESYWRNIKSGTDGITDVPATHWRLNEYFDPDPSSPDMTYGRRGGFLDAVPFNTLEFGIAPKNLEATDTTQLFALLAARDALHDAGYACDPKDAARRQFDRSRTCVVLGVTGALELVIPLGARLAHPQWRAGLLAAGVESAVADDVVSRIGGHFVEWQENSFPGLLGNVAAGRVANRFDLGGTNCVVDAACASSLGALHLAVLELQTGRADVALSGGIDTFNDIFMYMCFSKTPALSATGDCRPFDQNGDGTILGEGAGVVALKRLSDAERDGDRIRAVIRGIGSSSDGRGNAIYAPSASGQQRALRAAYADAGVTPDTVELFEAHGTGTRVGDAAEVDALTSVFSDSARGGTWCALGSVKSMIGHTKAAAGVAGLIKAALALEYKVLPPTLKVEAPLANLVSGNTPVYVNTHSRPWVGNATHPRRASLSAFGFGGSNFHCVLEEHKADKAYSDWSGDVTMVAISARNTETVKDNLRRLMSPLLQPHRTAGEHWQHVRVVGAQSRANFDANDSARAVVIIQRDVDAPHALGAALGAALTSAEHVLGEAPGTATGPSNGAHIGLGAPPGRLCALFPGQGAQRPDMLRELACLFPDFLSLAATADDCVARLGEHGAGPALSSRSGRLSDILFPQPAFAALARKEQSEALRNTAVAQPALGTVELAAWRVLERFGVQAEGFAGHSFGELVALAAAKRLGDRELLHLAAVRGKLMAGNDAATPGSAGRATDRGSMLAVALPAAELSRWLDASGLDLVIANLNGPRQTVLSGNTAHIGQAAQRLKDDGIQALALPVSAAFHSPLMQDACTPFARALEEVQFPPAAGGASVYANTSAQPYPDDPRAARALLTGQLTSSVRFTELVENMHAAGFRTFLELGPGHALSSMTQNILADEEAVYTLPLDASNGRGSGERDLAEMLGKLAALGYPLDLAAWDPIASEYVPPSTNPAVVMISGANPKRPTPINAPASNQGSTSQPAPLPESTANRPATSPTAAQPAPQSPPQSFPTVPSPSTSVLPLATAHSGAAESAPRLSVESTPAATPTTPATVRPERSFAEEAIRTLARMHEQTAELHRQYLDSVAAAHQSIQSLVHHLPGGAPIQATLAAAPAIAEIPTPSGPMPAPEHPLSVRSPASPPGSAGTPSPAPAEVRTPSAVAAHLSQADTSALVLDVVAHKTGYPRDMLRPEMELDADLGIDSIKRVEILAALQDILPEVAPPAPEALAELITLADVARAVSGDARPPAAERNPLPAPATAADPTDPKVPDSASTVLAVIADKTGYPPAMLSLSMQLDADLGIDSIKRIEILSALEEHFPNITAPDPQLISALESLEDIVALVAGDEASGASHPPPGDPSVAPIALAHGLRTARDTEAVLLRVVAEKTGYPTALLGLDMNMEADLGIGSIKRVEILAALEEELGIAAPADPETLGQLDTLRAVHRLLEVIPAEATAATTDASARIPAPALPASDREPIGSTDLEVLWPVSQPLRLENRRLLSLSHGSEVWVVDDGTPLAQQICQALAMHGLNGCVFDGDAPLGEAELASQAVSALVLLCPAAPRPNLLERATAVVQHFAPRLRTSGTDGDAILLAVTRLGGEFGLGPAEPDYPESAAIGGLVKCIGDEWPEVSCKVVDIGRPSADLGDLGDLACEIVDEMLLEGPVEVGLSPCGRVAVAFQPYPHRAPRATPDAQVTADDAAAPGQLAPGTPVIVSGGGKGITAAFALGLARRTACIPVLLGRTTLDTEEPPWLADASDDATIQRRLNEHSDFSTPAALARACADIRGRREVRATLAQFSQEKLEVRYEQVDIRDADAVRRTIRDVRNALGPIRGFVHGAGVIADRRIEDKTTTQTEVVYATKVRGFETLVEELESDLDLLCVFSSSSARYGRRGQTDYAGANEVVNKLARTLKIRRPRCRVASFNWGPWDGGMVTPALARVFHDDGIGLIDPAAGVQLGLDELLAADRDENTLSVEVVVQARAVANAPRSVQAQMGSGVGARVDAPLETPIDAPIDAPFDAPDR